jgi:hypothetical protein
MSGTFVCLRRELTLCLKLIIIILMGKPFISIDAAGAAVVFYGQQHVRIYTCSLV